MLPLQGTSQLQLVIFLDVNDVMTTALRQKPCIKSSHNMSYILFSDII